MSDEEESSSEQADRLLAEAKMLHARSGKPKPPPVTEPGTLQGLADDVRYVRRTVVNVKEGTLGFYLHFLQPIWNVIGPPIRWVLRQYRRFWQRFAFRTDRKTGERVLSRRRAGFVMGFTFLVLAGMSPTGLGDAIRFVTIEPVSDGILMATSMRTETFYLNNSEEIDHEENIHSVRGCRAAGMCAEADAAYFRVRPRLSHDVWKLWKYDNPIYVPDHVVAPIAPGVNKCSVTYYGYRMTSSWIARILRSLQFYPTMLEASCTYVGGTRQTNAELSAPE